MDACFLNVLSTEATFQDECPLPICLKPPKCSIVLSAAAAAQAFSIPSAKQQKCTVETMFDSACKLVCAIVQATAPSRKLAGDWCLDGFHKRLNG